MMEVPVSVRLTVDHLKASVIHFMPEYCQGIEKSVRRAVEAAANNFDWEGEIKRVAEVEFRRMIEAEVRNALAADEERKRSIIGFVKNALVLQ